MLEWVEGYIDRCGREEVIGNRQRVKYGPLNDQPRRECDSRESTIVSPLITKN